MKNVYIVTSVELGWDCIVGVFDPAEVTKDDLKKRFKKDHGYVIFENRVETNLDNYD